MRWFVPLLGPGYYALAVLLRDRPRAFPQFAALAVGGVALAAPMAWHGPWMRHMVPGYWPLVAGTLSTWGVASLGECRPAVVAVTGLVTWGRRRLAATRN